jgi:hypothetical protein
VFSRGSSDWSHGCIGPGIAAFSRPRGDSHIVVAVPGLRWLGDHPDSRPVVRCQANVRIAAINERLLGDFNRDLVMSLGRLRHGRQDAAGHRSEPDPGSVRAGRDGSDRNLVAVLQPRP